MDQREDARMLSRLEGVCSQKQVCRL
jgi:hypothetical protein